MKKKMLSAALLLAALLCLSAAAMAEEIAANEWQYSDIRKYLNNSVTDGQADSTEKYNSTNDSGYAAQFTDAEYDLMQPTRVDTLKDVNNPNDFVTTTDRIFLPSGRMTFNENVLSWGQEDLVGMNVSKVSDKNVLIPLGYWANGGDTRMWLRSAGETPDKAMSYRRADRTEPPDDLLGVKQSNVVECFDVAPVFRLKADDILFASAASAAVLALEPSQCMSTRINEGTSYLGIIEPNSTTPSYGMYLKTKYEDEDIVFKVRNLSCLDNVLSFEYAGGMPGDYVMIQAYGKDDFDRGATGYAAAKLIEGGHGTMSVTMSDEMAEFLKADMANRTFKIWMENPSSVNLAQATTPQTFSFSFKDGSLVEVNDAGAANLIKNLRMFAMKNELTCSWGDLDKLYKLSSGNFNNVVAGQHVGSGQISDSWMVDKSCGMNASNQIIYFGVEKSGNPLRFWIAGHGVDSGTDMDKLTLYQMYTNEMQKHVFRKEPDNQTPANLIFNPEITELEPGKSFEIDWKEYGSNPALLVSSNPYVATVDEVNKKVDIHNYGEFSIVLFSGDQILHTQTFSVDNPNPPDYTAAGKWPDDKTQEDEEQPEQPEEAVQDAADGLPQTGDSSVLLLWAAALAAALAGLAARRRRSA